MGNNKSTGDNNTNGTDEEKKTNIPTNSNDTDKLDNNYKNVEESTNNTTSGPLPAPPLQPPLDDDDPLQYMLKKPVITLYSQKMKGLKDLLLAEKLNTHAISLQVTAQSVASRKVRGIDKLGNHTTNSTYSSINVATGSGESSTAGDSIAVSRPKRTRRE